MEIKFDANPATNIGESPKDLQQEDVISDMGDDETPKLFVPNSQGDDTPCSPAKVKDSPAS